MSTVVSGKQECSTAPESTWNWYHHWASPLGAPEQLIVKSGISISCKAPFGYQAALWCAMYSLGMTGAEYADSWFEPSLVPSSVVASRVGCLYLVTLLRCDSGFEPVPWALHIRAD